MTKRRVLALIAVVSISAAWYSYGTYRNAVALQNSRSFTGASIESMSTEYTGLSALFDKLVNVLKKYQSLLSGSKDKCEGVDLSIIKYSNCISPFDEGGYGYGGGTSSSSGSGSGGGVMPPPSSEASLIL